jgi:hypothetical protein
MGSDIVDQQVGCLWQEDNILSVSLSGNINYLDPANPDKPRRILKVLDSAASYSTLCNIIKMQGHNKGILSAVHIPEKNRIYSGSYDGRIGMTLASLACLSVVQSVCVFSNVYSFYSSLGYQWSRNG